MDELDDTVSQLEQTLGVFAQTLVQQPRATVRPPSELKSVTTQTQGYSLGNVLGEGGMGTVRSAEQHSLRRTVAVKLLREQSPTNATKQLVLEALLTGKLEHPNITPIHDMVLREDGQPMVVMKRIEGVSWAELLADPSLVQKRFAPPDLFEWHLRVLLQVCNAVSFAAEQGILHRDLKPSNVMVGSFGEVYVVDWGLAVSMIDDGSGLPLASEARHLAGTPAYLAPEMLGGKQSALTLQTDVYLLGATLYEVACGEPPHRGENFPQLLQSVLREKPAIPASVPRGVATIIETAMARSPSNRFASVLLFKKALEAYLRHRGSELLAARSEESLRELHTLLTKGKKLSEEERLHVWRRYGESRFGFEQALREWPENSVARAGLEATVRALVEYELSLNNPVAAATLLDQLDRPPEELRQRVQAALQQHEREATRLASLAKDASARTGSRERKILLLTTGALWLGGTGARVVGELLKVQVNLASLWIVPASVLSISLLVFYRWRAVLNTRINRAAITGISLAQGAVVLMHALCWKVGVQTSIVELLRPLLWICVLGPVAVAVEAKLWWAALFYFASIVFGLHSGFFLHFFGFLGHVSLLTIAWKTIERLETEELVQRPAGPPENVT